MATKTVPMRPLAVDLSTGWGLVAGASIVAAVDPGSPVTHDDATSYVNTGDAGGTGTPDQPLRFTVRDKPNDILSVNSVSVIVREELLDATANIQFIVGLRGVYTLSTPAAGTTPGTGWGTRSASLSRPGGGAWLPADIAEPTFVFGVVVDEWTSAPSPGQVYNVSTLYPQVVYEAFPTQDDGVRDASSRRQRFFRSPPAILKRRVSLADGLRHDLLDVVLVSHRDGPHAQGEGWRSEPWQARPMRLIGRKINFSDNTVDLTLRDIRPQLCLLRYTGRAKTSSVIADGVAFFAAGSAIEFERASRAWVPDPSSGLYSRIEIDQPKFAAALAPATGDQQFGLLLEPAAQNIVLDSAFIRGAADTFTGWEEDEAGTGTITEDDSVVPWWDPAEVSRVAQLDMDSGGTGGALLKQTHPVTVTAGTVVRIAIAHYDEGDTLEYALRREVDNQFYDWSTEAFSASPVEQWLEIPFSDGEWARYWVSVDVGGSNTQLRSFIGRANARVTTTQVNRVTHFSIEIGDAPGITSPILTEAVTVTRAADDFRFTNDSGARCVVADRGAIAFVYVPNFDAADVSADVPVLEVEHDASNGMVVLWSHGNQRWELTYEAAGTTYTAAGAVGAGEPTVGVPVRLVPRWTGTAAELGTAHLLELFVDGAKGPTSDIKVTLTEAAASDLVLLPSSGVVRDLQVLALVPTDEECARLPRS